MLCEKFKEFGLQITASANDTIVDFLDVTFDLTKKEFKPYSKPGDSHLYVHTESNHPPTVTKRIPQSIQTRLSNISSNEEIFNSTKPDYENALHEAEHQTTLTYTPKETNNCRKERQHQRKRNITWFNPPFSRHVKTNIGRKFLALVEHHFPKGHQLSKICNRNTLKVSYSCMDNMHTITKAHNNKIINNSQEQARDSCNCRKKEDCPIPGKCTARNIIYEAKVATPDDEKIYIGLTSTSFKSRYATHKASFTRQN